MKPLVLFYSWQSDRDGNLCRHFISHALQRAADRILTEYGIEIRIDMDTAGVAGTPHVSDTILGKIASCDIFVADVTFVGATPAGKLMPNPNVMTEFGYARHCLAPQQMLLVMNKAFGQPSDLPFDLAHLRHPVSYEAAQGIADGERRRKRDALGDALIGPIKTMADAVMKLRSSEGGSESIWEPTYELAHRNEAAYAQISLPTLVSRPNLHVLLYPAKAASNPRLEPAMVKAARGQFKPWGYDLVKEVTDGQQWSSYDTPSPVAGMPNSESRWMTRLIRPGILETVIQAGMRIDDDETILLYARQIESLLMDSAERLIAIATSVGLDGPARIVAYLDGMEDVQIGTERNAGRKLGRLSLSLGEAKFAAAAQFDDADLRDMMDKVWLSAGFDDGSPSFRDGKWIGRDGGAPYALPTMFRRF